MTPGRCHGSRGHSPSRTANEPAQRIDARSGSVSNHARLRALGIQPKLEVSSPGDEYEREADRVADRVMRMPAGATAPLPISRVAAAHTQRMCADCEEEEKGAVQRKEASTASPGRVPANPIPGGGAPLPHVRAGILRAALRPRFE